VTGRFSPLLQGGVLLRQREEVEKLTPLANNYQIHNSRTDPALTWKWKKKAVYKKLRRIGFDLFLSKSVLTLRTFI
jgi:hypothetical protein